MPRIKCPLSILQRSRICRSRVSGGLLSRLPLASRFTIQARPGQSALRCAGASLAYSFGEACSSGQNLSCQLLQFLICREQRCSFTTGQSQNDPPGGLAPSTIAPPASAAQTLVDLAGGVESGPGEGIESWRSSGMRICSTSSYRVICYRCAVGNGGFPAHGWCPLRSWGPGGATEPAAVSAAHGACSGRAISPHS